MTRVAITGSRDWGKRSGEGFAVVDALVTLNPRTDFVILGDEPNGADARARAVCEELGLPHRVHEANWKTYHRAAGPIRNRAMLDDGPDEVWFFHDDLPRSKGTKNCVEQARKRGIPVRNGRDVPTTPKEERC